MDGASIDTALQRIETALARIEGSLETATVRPAEEAAELQARHDRLRSAVAQSLRQLDDLLASQQK